MNRRNFIFKATLGAAFTSLSAATKSSTESAVMRINAVAFDAFAIFDPRPIYELVKLLYPDKGAELGALWKAKQFEYTWLRTAAGQYADFWKTTQDALEYAADKLQIPLKEEHKTALMQQYLKLQVWPDVAVSLQELQKRGIKLVFLSNMTEKMLQSSAEYSKIHTYFTHYISVDPAKAYKPSPAAYQLGIERLGFRKEEILFVAFASWDAAGARWFGYPTFWLNRAAASPEKLDIAPDGQGQKMSELLVYINKMY